jgi:hypothetical protein
MERWEPGWISRSSDCPGTVSMADPFKEEISLRLLCSSRRPRSMPRTKYSAGYRRRFMSEFFAALSGCYARDGEASELIIRRN